MSITLKFKKLHPSAVVPTYGSASAAGADLYACLEQEVTLQPGETRLIPTGLAMAIPEGYVGLIFARSGLASKRGLAPANKVGVIDSDYRGEIMVALHNHSSLPASVAPQERIAQILFTQYAPAVFEQAEELDCTERGAGGFGSTGVK